MCVLLLGNNLVELPLLEYCMLALSESPAPTRYALTDALSLTSNNSTQPSPPLNPQEHRTAFPLNAGHSRNHSGGTPPCCTFPTAASFSFVSRTLGISPVGSRLYVHCLGKAHCRTKRRRGWPGRQDCHRYRLGPLLQHTHMACMKNGSLFTPGSTLA